MNKPLIYSTKIAVKADPEKVWKALTDPDLTMQYMFGCRCETDWQPGNSVLWRGSADGVIYVSGKAVRFEPNSVLSYTVFDPNGNYEDIPENHLTVEYILVPQEDGSTLLRVYQGDYAKVAEGSNRFAEADAGWQMTLEALKKTVENL